MPLLQVCKKQLYCDSLISKNVECVGYNFNLILYAQGESVRETETEQARVLVGGSFTLISYEQSDSLLSSMFSVTPTSTSMSATSSTSSTTPRAGPFVRSGLSKLWSMLPTKFTFTTLRSLLFSWICKFP